MNPIGVNALAHTIDDRGEFLNFIQRSKPGAIIVMDDVGLAQSALSRSPKTLVIHRSYSPDDTRWHEIMTPAEFLSAHRATAAGGALLIQVFNERDPNDIDAYIDWLIELMALASAENIRLAIGSFAVGTPNEEGIKSGKWDRLIRALSKSIHFLILHEYFQNDPDTEIPWLCGRLTFWLDRAKTIGVAPPAIIIGEHGRDVGGGEHDGFADTGWSEQHYFDLMVRAQKIYAPHFVFICIFCYGKGYSSRWKSFDIEHAETLKTLIIQYGK